MKTEDYEESSISNKQKKKKKLVVKKGKLPYELGRKEVMNHCISESVKNASVKNLNSGKQKIFIMSMKFKL